MKIYIHARQHVFVEIVNKFNFFFRFCPFVHDCQNSVEILENKFHKRFIKNNEKIMVITLQKRRKKKPRSFDIENKIKAIALK